MPETVQVFNNQEASPPTISVKRSKIKYFVLSAVSVILTASLSLGYLFWLAPEAAAKEFVAKTSEKFEEVTNKVDSIYQDFSNIKDKLPLAYSSFEEIATPTADYDYITKDTDEDIADIESIIALVGEAQEQLADLKKPGSVKKLSRSLEEYYATLQDILNNLLEHQRLNQQLLAAHGKELYEAVKKMENLMNNGGLRVDWIETSLEVSRLAEESKKRHDLITDVNPNEQDYYRIDKEYFEDLEVTFEKVAPLIENGSDKEASDLTIAFSDRTKARNARVQANSDKFIATSVAALGFKKLSSLERNVLEELTVLSEKLGLEDVKKKKEASPSAKPKESSQSSQASPSAKTQKVKIEGD